MTISFITLDQRVKYILDAVPEMVWVKPLARGFSEVTIIYDEDTDAIGEFANQMFTAGACQALEEMKILINKPK
jgi:hypothetical protein